MTVRDRMDARFGRYVEGELRDLVAGRPAPSSRDRAAVRTRLITAVVAVLLAVATSALLVAAPRLADPATGDCGGATGLCRSYRSVDASGGGGWVGAGSIRLQVFQAADRTVLIDLAGPVADWTLAVGADGRLTNEGVVASEGCTQDLICGLRPGCAKGVPCDHNRWLGDALSTGSLSIASHARSLTIEARGARLRFQATTADAVAATPMPVPASSVLIRGHRVSYAGRVPWSSPSGLPAHSRVLTVFADDDRAAGGSPHCGIEANRVLVTETPTTIRVAVLGYSAPLTAGTFCNDLGHANVRLTVHLREPIGDRMVIDDATDAESLPIFEAAAG